MAKPEITVATIGSGPGSDILGILKYVAKHAPNTFVTCHQYDRLDKWYVHWAEIESQIGGRWFQTDFHHFDLLDSSAVPPPSLWPSVDLFTFSYVIAELVTQKEQAKATLAHLFSSAKRGATFLFIDNDRKHYRDFIRELTAPYGISVLMQAPTCMTITFGEDELNELEELERMFAKWRSTNHKPAATWLICQKQ